MFWAAWHHELVQFEGELAHTLPADVPNRDRLIEKAAQHLHLIAAANEFMNLTRITDAREAAIKHVYDSVAPWKSFEGAKRVLDVGTGAGFPGIPLALVLPAVRFSLIESVGKKARFVDGAVESLDLSNVDVVSERAEEVLRTQKADIITARAVAPMSRLLELFGRHLRNGTRMLLYKGPDVEKELEEAAKYRIEATVVCRYDLPHALGTRTLIELRGSKKS